jgi:hypothetical protein
MFIPTVVCRVLRAIAARRLCSGPMSNQTIRTNTARTAILKALAQGKSISAACRAARIARSSYYLWHDEDPEFAKDVADAIEDGTDKLEDSSYRQALQGNTALMVLLLKARRRAVYGDKPIDLNHTQQEPFRVILERVSA